MRRQDASRGTRGIYDKGWLAGSINRLPWETASVGNLKDKIWELYDTRNDFSLVIDLAKKDPAKLKEMQALFMQQAEVNHVLPIDTRAPNASTRRLRDAST